MHLKDQKTVPASNGALQDPNNTVLLVDVSSMYFRAFYAIRELSNSAGLPTNALYGFTTMTLKLLEYFKPKYIAYCFDSREPSFRKTMYTEYKANRSAMPEDLVQQMPFIEPITTAFGIQKVALSTYEADDLIGTLAAEHSKAGRQVVIVSSDKDFAQLVSDRVRMFDPSKDLTIDAAVVFEKWGVRPDQFVDYLALVGDDSDNIPGVRGIGPKGAQKLLGEYGSLKSIYEHVEEIQNPSMKTRLIEGKTNAFLSKDLSQILLTSPVDLTLPFMEWKSVQWDQLKPLLETLEFKTLVKQWQPRWGESRSESTKTADITEPLNSLSAPQASVASFASIPNVAARLLTSESVGTSGPLESATPPKTESELRNSIGELENGTLSQVIAAAISGKVLGLHQAPHELVLWSEGIYWNGSSLEALEALKSVDLTRIHFMGFDLKNLFHQFFGDRVFRVFGSLSWDHLLAGYTLKTGDQPKFEEMVKAELGTAMSDIPSAEEIVQNHLLLKATLEQKLRALDQLQICRDIEFALVPVLFDIEEAGVLVDRTNLLEQSKSLLEDIQVLEKKITELAGENFNIASPKQLAHILFEKFKLKPLRKTKSGFSTDADVLEALSAEAPIAGLVLDYRELTKLKSTYVDALPLLIDAKTGRIHTTYNQALTATGRLSSEDPNLQNIPIRTERGSRVRGAFIAPPGRVLISLDYGQIELRVLAEVTSDEGLAKAFRENIDIHRLTASEVFGVIASAVTDEQRRVAKAVNFGVAYGMGAFGLAENLKISRTEAQGIIDRYFKQFPGVKSYMHEIVEAAKRDGFVTTLFGRRRYIDELQSSNPNLRRFGERAAINAPIQGTASDIVKLAMIKIARSEMKARMLMQVHDELVFESEESSAQREMDLARMLMTDFKNFKTPLVVEGRIGKNWNEAH